MFPKTIKHHSPKRIPIMKNFKPIYHAAIILLKQNTFSYDSYFPEEIPKHIKLFDTHYLLLDWDEEFVETSFVDTWPNWKTTLEHIFNKKLTVYP